MTFAVKLGLLGIGQRTVRVVRPSMSLHFRRLRDYPTSPKTIGEHLRKKRIDQSLSVAKLIRLLDLGVTDNAVELWEKNRNRLKGPNRERIVQFLGFDPELANPTGNP